VFPKRTSFLKKSNIVFDIHAYEKWLLDSETNRKQARFIKTTNFNSFGAPMNAGILMDPHYFLNAVYNRGFLYVHGYGNTLK
jgi:mannan endo-1,4-beta-mannosidase